MTRALSTAYALGGVALAGVGLVPFLEHTPEVDSWFTMQWPRDLPEDRVVTLLRHLAASRHPRLIALEVRAHEGRLTYQVGVPEADATQIPRTFAAFLPGVLLEPVEQSRQTLRYAIGLPLETHERALRTDAAEEISRSLTTALAAAGRETVVVQWLLGYRLAPMFVGKEIHGLPSTPQWVWRSVMGTHQPLEPRAQTELRRKVGDHGFRGVLRIGIDLPEPRTARQVLRRVVGALKVAEGPDAGFRVRRTEAQLMTRAAAPRRWPRAAINVGELAGLLAWPIGGEVVSGIDRLTSRRLPPSPLVPSNGRVVADGTDPLHLRPLAQTSRDALLHTHVIGPTGVGKSTLLASLIIQDIATGHGAVVIDPKGHDLVNEVLRRIPPTEPTTLSSSTRATAPRLDSIRCTAPASPASW